MSQYLKIHPDNPQKQLIQRAVDILQRGGLIVYPTDSCYALGCHLGNKAALDRIRQLRKLDKKHHFTLVCSHLSEISQYAKIDNINYRLIKSLVPGPYTFILKATREVPKRLQHPKRKDIGLRVPDNRITQFLLNTLNEPIMSTTLILPDDELPMTDPYQIRLRLEDHVDLIIDGGFCGYDPTSVVDLTTNTPLVLRKGKGRLEWLYQH